MQGKSEVGAWGIIPTFNLEGARAHPIAHGNFPMSLPQNSLDFCGAERWGGIKNAYNESTGKAVLSSKIFKIPNTTNFLSKSGGNTYQTPAGANRLKKH